MVEALYLVEFRLSSGTNGLCFYTLYIDDDQPITRRGRPIVFASTTLAEVALEASDFAEHRHLPLPNDVYAQFEVSDAICYLEDAAVEKLPNTELLDCVNLLLDFAKLVTFPLSKETESLGLLADHLTFSLDIGEFFRASSLTRVELSRAMKTCLGAILTEVVVIGEGE